MDAFIKENPNAERYVFRSTPLRLDPAAHQCRLRLRCPRSPGACTNGSSQSSIPKVTAHYADVSDPESVEACINEIIAEHGKIDNLVTSAGFTENFEAVNYPIDRMRKLWAVNVDGTYLFATSVARHLMNRNAPGSMVMIGSMSGSIVNVPQPQA
jgi:NAD(P)-dependent dehydrogenase (short-subunit alcohol dehydrogenase family)